MHASPLRTRYHAIGIVNEYKDEWGGGESLLPLCIKYNLAGLCRISIEMLRVELDKNLHTRYTEHRHLESTLSVGSSSRRYARNRA